MAANRLTRLQTEMLLRMAEDTERLWSAKELGGHANTRRSLLDRHLIRFGEALGRRSRYRLTLAGVEEIDRIRAEEETQDGEVS